ncbi:MAG TPA: chemotaxis protein CheW [Paenalcaligenes sp.]|nr:chemotaxis protein CheW [Paenalcaligenes sp.]
MTYQKANNADTVSGRQEFLVFVLNEQEYGIDILKVQEIRGYQEQSVTRIANVPPFVKGVTNLRGVIVPIIDMRIKFNLPDVKYDNQTVVVILNVADRVIGVVVDGVSDVLTLAAEQISDAPQFGSSAFSTEYLVGIGTIDERMLILVDIEKLITSEEMELVEGLSS